VRLIYSSVVRKVISLRKTKGYAFSSSKIAAHHDMEGVEPTNASDINAAISVQTDTASKGRRTPNIETPSEISDKESVATPSNLRQYRISAAEGPPELTLPAIQMSPPRSASAASPNDSRSLPSLRIALTESESRDLDVPINGTSPAVCTEFFLQLFNFLR
jgi:hypothetical protein